MNALRAVIELEESPDYDPDLSWLTQDYAGEPDAELYKAQDKRRLDAYNNGDWYMIVLTAKATVTGEVNGKTLTREEYESCGGIESDGGDYLQEIGDDLKASLIKQLRDWYPGIEIEEA